MKHVVFAHRKLSFGGGERVLLEQVAALATLPVKVSVLFRKEPGKRDLEPELRDYLATWNAGRIMIVNIESVPAMDRLDALLDVPDLDAVLIGPHDLSLSMGIPERYRDPVFDVAIGTIIHKARARNLGVGLNFPRALELRPTGVQLRVMRHRVHGHLPALVRVRLGQRQAEPAMFGGGTRGVFAPKPFEQMRKIVSASASPRASMAVVELEGASPSGQASSIRPMSSTTSL